MTSALLMFLLSVIKAQSVSSLPSCPAVCVVCSKEAVICQRLAYIIDAPQTTQALLLTEGSIAAVQPGALSDLSNVTVISLSHNHISVLDEQSFRNMPFLQTLLLDHNFLTSQALQRGALTNLTQLEVLALGNNRISMIQSDLLKGTKALRILKLEGNLITRLDSGSFPQYDLQVLESLDLSDNFIDYLDKSSFRGLISLKTLDLSRNRIQTAPSEAFSYLSWLTNLNLDLNSWNCSCHLLELAAFLSTFLQEPNKTLYNGRRMVCVSADNPAVTTVLELTEANCVPSNQNITVRIDTRGSITPHLYVRDMAITGVICFTGGVGLTLLIVLIYYKVSLKKKLREQKSQEEVKEEGRSTMSNHNRNHNDIVERRKDFMNYNGARDAHLLPRPVENESHFRCPECRVEEPIRWERMNGRIETLEDREKQRMRIEEDRRMNGLQQRNMARDSLNKQIVSNSIDMEVKSKSRQEFLHCRCCHRTYRPNQMEQNLRQGRAHPNLRDASLIPQHRPNDQGRDHFNNEFDIKSLGLKKETRNVTFNLESLRRASGADGENEEDTTPRTKERWEEKKHKAQSSRLLKVKLNLNPLRKSKVHPNKKSEEKVSSRKSREKRKDGKDSRDKEGRGKKTKDSKGKTKKSKGSSEVGEKDDGGGKRKTSSKKKKSKSEQESARQNVDGKETFAQVAPPAALGQMQGLLGAQFKGGGLLLGNTQLPFSLADRNRTTNLLGSSGSSQLPFQGSNFLLNSMPQGNAMFPTGPASTVTPNINLGGPSMVPGGAPDNLMRQSSMGLTASSNSLKANIVQGKQTSHNLVSLQTNPATLQSTATTLQANTSIVQANTTTLPPNTSSQNLQALATNLAANPSVTPTVGQSDSKIQPQPESPTVARVKSNLVQEPLQSTPTSTSETLTSTRKESQTLLVTDSSPVVVPQTSATATAVEDLSNSNSVTGSVSTHGEGRVVTLTEGPTAAMTVGGTQAADVSVSGVAAHTGSTDNAASTSLIQQEYVSDDGSSSPRRKLRLVIPEKTSSRPPTALERKIR